MQRQFICKVARRQSAVKITIQKTFVCFSRFWFDDSKRQISRKMKRLYPRCEKVTWKNSTQEDTTVMIDHFLKLEIQHKHAEPSFSSGAQLKNCFWVGEVLLRQRKNSDITVDQFLNCHMAFGEYMDEFLLNKSLFTFC